jgi:hypothetical protein
MVAVSCLATQGQGRFLFSTYAPPENNVSFTLAGGPATGPDLFVQVFAGPDLNHLAPLEPLLALNQTGAMAGFPNPLSQTYSVPGMPSGSEALVAYVGFRGASLETASVRSPLNPALIPVTLIEPPEAPNEVQLGTMVVIIDIPEPPTPHLELIGACCLVFALSLRSRVFAVLRLREQLGRRSS